MQNNNKDSKAEGYFIYYIIERLRLINKGVIVSIFRLVLLHNQLGEFEPDER